LLIFAPESPWYLARNGRLDEAEHSVKRLSSKSKADDAKLTVALMVHTDNIEKRVQANTSYLQCFKGTELRRTEIACVVFFSQAFNGVWLTSPPVYFFEQAGLAASSAYKVNVGSSSLELAGVIVSWIALTYVGRRRIYLAGMGTLMIFNLLIGFLSLAPASNHSALVAVEAITLIWVFVYGLTLCSIIFTIVSEISSSRVRAKSICLARITYNVGAILAGILEPYMLNPSEWNWKGKAGFFWGGWTAVLFCWAYFRLPESQGRTYAELDMLFEKRISARKFKHTEVDVFADEAEVLKELSPN
jgi:MFS transporter, SP family, general alpha glucoside:H+ symporter